MNIHWSLVFHSTAQNIASRHLHIYVLTLNVKDGHCSANNAKVAIDISNDTMDMNSILCNWTKVCNNYVVNSKKKRKKFVGYIDKCLVLKVCKVYWNGKNKSSSISTLFRIISILSSSKWKNNSITSSSVFRKNLHFRKISCMLSWRSIIVIIRINSTVLPN